MSVATPSLDSPIIVGHSNFLESTLILLMTIYVGRIEFQPTLFFSFFLEN